MELYRCIYQKNTNGKLMTVGFMSHINDRITFFVTHRGTASIKWKNDNGAFITQEGEFISCSIVQ
jgi:hypothetical protein